MAGKYIGFDRLKSELAGKSGVKNSAALAASIGRKKASRAGRPLSQRRDNGDTKITEDDPRFNPAKHGNKRGSKNTRQEPMNGQYRPT